MTETPLFVYAALGDSTAVGYGAPYGEGYVDRLYQKMARHRQLLRLENLATSGARLPDVAGLQSDAALKLRPSIITFFAGTNDLLRNTSLEDVLAALDRAVARFPLFGCPVIVGTLPDVRHSPLIPVLRWRFPGYSVASVSQRVDAVNERLREHAKRGTFRLVDVFAESKRVLGERPDYFCPDGVHPSSLGYKAIAEAFWPAVAQVIGAPQNFSLALSFLCS